MVLSSRSFEKLYRLVYMKSQAPDRPRTPETDSRQRMLEAAINLMRGTGLAGAGINEIIRESGAPKGSVYHHFPGGKLALASEALRIYARRVRDFIDAALASRARPAGKVRALFAAFAQRVEASGCLRSCAVGAVGLDLDAGSAPLQPVLAAAFEDWVDCIAGHFDLGDARRTRSFASLLLTTVEGAYIRCRVAGNKHAFVESGRWLAELVKP
jgi:TetR/AcrR family transcriptional regulator, lmrAB and yxaGH operons repressor